MWHNNVFVIRQRAFSCEFLLQCHIIRWDAITKCQDSSHYIWHYCSILLPDIPEYQLNCLKWILVYCQNHFCGRVKFFGIPWLIAMNHEMLGVPWTCYKNLYFYSITLVSILIWSTTGKKRSWSKLSLPSPHQKHQLTSSNNVSYL